MAIRTICIPVAEIIDGGTKQEFYADLRKTLDLSVRIANISATECIKQDDLTKDKPPKIYTYPAVKNIAAGASNAASSIARAVEKSYRQDRWQMIRGNRSLRSYRSQPWPLLCNKSSKTLNVEDCGEFLTARIKLLGGWWTVRLAGGSAYRDHVRGLRNCIKICDSKVWVDRKHKAVLGIACDFSAVKGRQASGTMTVTSHREHLICGTFERLTTPFIVNADVVHQWQAESSRRYARLRQDRKSGANRRRIREEMNRISDKHQRRMKTLVHEVTARVVERALRRKVATIKLDLTIKSYSKSFPWFDFEAKLKYKCEMHGIDLLVATQAVEKPSIDKPHVYFKYSPATGRVKIGKTQRSDGGRHGSETDSAEELTILAIDNQPKTKLTKQEKHYHAMFQEHRVKGEWFDGEPVIEWLREAGWFGNAGNLSQIAQILDVSHDASGVGHLMPNSECPSDLFLDGCSQKADNQLGYVESNQPAPAVNNRTNCN